MTKEEILAMEAGKELDKLVATEVMGEPMPELTPENARDLQLVGAPVKSPKGNWLCLCAFTTLDIPTWRPLPFSTDISAAWLVVEKMRAEGFMLYLQGDIKLRGWECNIYKTVPANYPARWFQTAPDAICKAALLTRLDEIKRLGVSK